MIIATTNQTFQYDAEMTPLIEPDNGNYWAVRYVWIQHLTDNDTFLKNYFTGKDIPGMNIRKSTTHIQEYWYQHNKLFDISGNNGDLVWRVKTLNTVSQSIDYIEIWKTQKIVDDYFLLNEADSVLPDGSLWTKENKINLDKGILDTGFVVRNWVPHQTISRPQAMSYYKHFVQRAISKDNCIINTLFKPELHLEHQI